MHTKCGSCGGTKTVIALGMMTVTCKTCNGVGYVESVVAAPLLSDALPKRGRPAAKSAEVVL